MINKMIKDCIEKSSLFNGLTDDSISKIIEISQLQKYSKNSVIINQGEEGDSLMLIAKGKVEIQHNIANSKEIIKLSELEVLDFFGEMALIDIAPRNATAVAIVDTEIIAIHHNDLSELLSGQNSINFLPIIVNIARGLSLKLRNADDTIISISNLINKYKY